MTKTKSFMNNQGKTQKVRVPVPKKQEASGYKWITVKANHTVEIPEEIGKSYGFILVNDAEGEPNEPTTESIDPGEIPEETKGDQEGKESLPEATIQEEEDQAKQYFLSLTKINGIGNKTAKDLVQIYPTKTKLIQALQSEDGDLPIRDDLIDKIKEAFL